MEIKLLPRPMTRLVQTMNKKDLVGVEIGILHGVNAASILQTLSIKKLYLVDPYMTYPEYLDIKAPVFSRVRKDAEKRLGPYKDKIDWKIMKSADAVHLIPDDLDFVYIDGNHSYKFCLEDIKNYWPKIKTRGVIGGHDYYNMSKAREVKKAVDQFAEENKLKVWSAVGGGLCDWWIMKNGKK